MTASDISRGRLRYLRWDYDDFGRDRGAQHVVEAVRASMSIPFFYRPVGWDSPGGGEAWLVDGGMLSNFPITAFDAPPGTTPRWPTLGIELSAPPGAVQGTGHPIADAVSMTRAMLRTMTGFYDQMHIESADAQARTIFVDTGSVRATDFDLTDDARDFLYRSGRDAAAKFLDGTSTRPARDFQQYIAAHRS
jgi:NTE family protein